MSDGRLNLSGIGSSGSALSAHLVELALGLHRKTTSSPRALVVKLFHGGGYSQLVEAVQAGAFRLVKPVQAQGLARPLGRDLSGRHRD